MHSRLKLIHNYLFRNFNKHIAFNILGRICYRRCHCMLPYGECSLCSKKFDKCHICDWKFDVYECEGKDCEKLICSDCLGKHTYGKDKSYCRECFYMCGKCKEYARTHVHEECGYGLCDDCYKYSQIIYDNGRSKSEICPNCNKKIRTISHKNMSGIVPTKYTQETKSYMGTFRKRRYY